MPKLQDLASTFADSVLAAIRRASLDELTPNGKGSGVVGAGRARGGGGMSDPLHKPKTSNGGRLARRSPEDIEKALGLVLAALKGTKGKGMRAEEIRKFLNLDVREVPRILKHGVETKQLKSKGQKRATTYFVR